MARRDGTRITVLDKLTYAGNRANLAAVEDDDEQAARFAFVRGDIADRDVVAPLVAQADAVVNVAAETHVDRSILDPEAFLRTGVIGVHVLLEAVVRETNRARAGGRATTPRFLQVSTDEVYGDIPEGRSTETDALAPRSPYAAAKAAGELLVRAYHVTYGLDAVITRGSNTYGPHQHPEKLIPLFTTNALAGEPLPMYGDGMQVRDWLHVSDHAAGIDFVLRHGEAGEAYNVAGGTELPNRDVIGRLLAAAGPRLVAGPDGPGPPGPRPPLRDGRVEAGGAGLAAAGELRGRAARRPSPGTATTRTGWRAPGAATGTATTRASTATGWRRAGRWSRRTRRSSRRRERRGPALTAMRVAVIGVNGRLGRALVEALEEAPFTGTRGPIGWDQPERRARHADGGGGRRAARRRTARGRDPHRRLDGRGRLRAGPGARDAPQRDGRG